MKLPEREQPKQDFDPFELHEKYGCASHKAKHPKKIRNELRAALPSLS